MLLFYFMNRDWHRPGKPGLGSAFTNQVVPNWVANRIPKLRPTQAELVYMFGASMPSPLPGVFKGSA